MEQTQISKEVYKIIKEKLEPSVAIQDSSKLGEDLGADSLDTVEIVMELEKSFQISIPNEASEKVSTVADVIALISSLKTDQ